MDHLALQMGGRGQYGASDPLQILVETKLGKAKSWLSTIKNGVKTSLSSQTI